LVPTLQLAKKNYRAKLGHDANADRDERTKKRYELARGRTRENTNESGRERRRLVESSLPVAQIDFSQPITSKEEEGNRNKGNEEAFSSD